MYHVFHRTWWKHNPTWPNQLEPCAGRKHTIGEAESIDEARAMCKGWNASNNPGRFSDKAEFERA